MQINRIKDEYFEDNFLEEVLKNDNEARPYLYISVKYENNNVFIPFRTNIKNEHKLKHIIENISFDVSFDQKPMARLDFRKLLIINDLNYIKENNYIPNKQYAKVKNNINTIEDKVIKYFEGYIKAYNKNRVSREDKYVHSSLRNITEN